MERYEWLKSAVFYEIYPTSFYDSNGDGVGDIEGIIEKLDYVSGLGVNGIWINPLFRSPFRDGGYDVADYKSVDPRFGENEDLERLFAEAKKRDIRILLDLVPGHTSDRHPWFMQSKRAERNRWSDYYIWTDNVWTDASKVGIKTVNGMCERDGNYAINFFSMQPALNYGFYNPTESWQTDWKDEKLLPLRRELIEIMRFWLKRGCSGFRVDMAYSLVKNDDDGKANAAFWNEVLTEVRAEFPDALFVSEWSYPKRAVGGAGFDMDFMLHIGNEAYTSLFRYEERGGVSCFRRGSEQSFRPFFEYYDDMRSQLNGRGFISIPSGNHDMSRLAYGRDEREVKTAFAFLMTMPSVPFVYYGDEIFMNYQRLTSKDGGYNRTGARTPMQWSGGRNAGFSESGEPYLPTDADTARTVSAMEGKGGSVLETVRTLIGLRRKEKALRADCDIRVLSGIDGGALVYEREGGGERITVALNPRGQRCEVRAEGKLLLGDGVSFKGGAVRFDGVGFAIVKG